MKYPPIATNRVIRFYASYVGNDGKIHRKGFNTRNRALRFQAKQILLDRLFGEHQELKFGFQRPGLALLNRDGMRKELRLNGFTCDEIVYGYGDVHDCCAGSEFCRIKWRKAIDAIVAEIEETE
jgi:hypothetical protein